MWVRTLSSLFAVATASLWSTVGQAQTGPQTAAQPQADNSTGLADIVVTAERRAESVQRSSLSIESFTGKAIQQAGVVQAGDISKLSPGVIIGEGGPVPQIYIRGVGDFTSTPVTNPAVAVNADGVYVARSSAIEGNFYDLERIEVLKGPQGTLYGRNASAGAINIISRKPGFDKPSANLTLEGSDYGKFQADGAINLPLGDTVAVRGAFQIVRRDGYSTQGLDDDKHQSGRLQLAWRPSSTIDLRLSGDYSHIGGEGPAYVFKGVAPSLAAGLQDLGVKLPADPRANGLDPSLSPVFFGVGLLQNRCIPNAVLATARENGAAAPIIAPQGLCANGFSSLIAAPANSQFKSTPFVDNRFLNLSAELNWDFGPAKLTILPAFRDAKLDFETYPLFSFLDSERSKQYSVEARVGNNSPKLKWAIGFYFFNESETARTRADGGVITGGNTNVYQLGTTSYAGFGQATYSVTSAFRLIGGLRYTSENRTIDGQNLVQYPSPLFDAGGACFNGPELCLRDVFVGDRTYRRTSFKAGAEFDVAPANMLYATVSTGHKMGGFSPFSIAGSTNTASSYEPERLLAYEAGSRNRFLDNRLQVNLEGFLWKYKNAQEFITTLNRVGGAANALVNAGSATIYGADLDVVMKLSPRDTIHAGAEWLHTNFDSFVYTASGAVSGVTTGCAVTQGVPLQTLDCSGKPLPRAPSYSGTADFTHRFDLANGAKLEFTAAAQFSGSRYLTVDYTPVTKADAYIQGDFTLTYTASKRWSIAAFVRNVGDAQIYTGAFTQAAILPGLAAANVAAPRTFGARLSLSL